MADPKNKLSLSHIHIHSDTHKFFKTKQYRKYFHLVLLSYGKNCEKTCGSAKKDSSAT